MPLGLSALARRYLTEPDAFKRSVVVPSLVWAAPNMPNEGEKWDVTDVGTVLTRPTNEDPLVLNVEKVPGRANPFAMGVTVGRVETNDIIVDDASVSRFHAWLQHDDRHDQWYLCDAESKNGTWLDAVKLTPSQKVKLNDGSIIRFGDAEMKFLLPTSLVRYVELVSTR